MSNEKKSVSANEPYNEFLISSTQFFSADIFVYIFLISYVLLTVNIVSLSYLDILNISTLTLLHRVLWNLCLWNQFITDWFC